MEFFHGTNIDFIGKRKTFFILSIVVTVLGLAFSAIAGVKYGIDFVGGTEVAVEFASPVETKVVREAMDKSHFEGSEIKSYGKANQFLIRVPLGLDGADASTKIVETLKTAVAGNEVKILKVDKIGPKVGAELRTQAFYAVILSILAILVYVAFRFEFVYGLGAIIALVHDVAVAFAFAVVFNKLGIINLEMNQNQIAAFLTVVGFSINDTVIIFDRIRENQERHKGMPLAQLMNLSINETLSRTLNTVATVVIVLLIMVLFGGEVLQGFSFTMLIGILTGTYSSIYIASSYVIWHMEKFGHGKKAIAETPSKKKVSVA